MMVDARGMRCPWPAIRAARALRASGGEPVEISADDPAAERELRALAQAAGATFEISGTAESRRFRIVPMVTNN